MKITKENLKQMIKEELDTLTSEEIVTEDPSLEHITPENIKMVLQAIAPLLGAGGAAILGTEMVTKVMNRINQMKGQPQLPPEQDM